MTGYRYICFLSAIAQHILHFAEMEDTVHKVRKSIEVHTYNSRFYIIFPSILPPWYCKCICACRGSGYLKVRKIQYPKYVVTELVLLIWYWTMNTDCTTGERQVYRHGPPIGGRTLITLPPIHLILKS